jgi:MFS family permease
MQPTKIHEDFRHNMTVNVLDGAFFGLGMGFASLVTVMPLFVDSLTDSTILIGLIAAVHTIGWQLPQLLMSNRVAGLPLFRPLVLRMTFHERWPFIALAAVAIALPFIGIPLALALTFVFLIWQSLGAGFTGTPWQSMIGKIMPEQWRGTFYGLQVGAVGLFSAIGAVAAGLILTRFPYPSNFGLCFFLAAIAMFVSYVFIWLTREPVTETTQDQATTLKNFWHNVGLILRRDVNFRWFLLVQLVAQFAIMAVGFFTIYGVRQFEMNAETAGFMTGLMSMVQMVSSPAAGWLGDRWGHRRVYAVGMMALGLAVTTAILAPDVGWFYAVFALVGFSNGVRWTNVLTMTVEFGTEADRPYYIGLANTLIAPATLVAPLIGGAVADAFGFGPMFWIALIAALLTAFILIVVMVDPRALRPKVPVPVPAVLGD